MRREIEAGETGSLVRQWMPELDILRGVACVMVVSQHVRYYGGITATSLEWFHVDHWGDYALLIFLGLSGYLTTARLLQEKINPQFISAFYWRRFLRIVPLYYAVLLLCAAGGWYYGRPIGVLDGILYVVLMPNIPALLHGTELFQPLLPIWFIAVEVQFYALWPWIIKKFDGPLSVLTCLMFMGGAIVCRWMIFQWKGGGVEGLAWNHLLTLSWMDCLSLGALLAILVHGGVINQRNGKMIAVFSSLGALVGVVLLTGTNWTLWGVRGFVEAFAMVNIILLTQSFSRWGKIESSFVGQVLSWTGKLSYGIYLVHVFVLAVLTEGMTRPLPTSSYILAVALILAISSGLAYLLWYLIERPCYAWGSVA